MFYTNAILSKKGPLAKVWLAAHWDKKLTKAHVFETNIEEIVEGIIHPKVKLALRTSGHLLLGVVRIYSRKTKYLLADCNEAYTKIKSAFRPVAIDLPTDQTTVAKSAITLQVQEKDIAPRELRVAEIDFDLELELDISDKEFRTRLTQHTSREADITLKESLILRDESRYVDEAAVDEFGGEEFILDLDHRPDPLLDLFGRRQDEENREPGLLDDEGFLNEPFELPNFDQTGEQNADEPAAENAAEGEQQPEGEQMAPPDNLETIPEAEAEPLGDQESFKEPTPVPQIPKAPRAVGARPKRRRRLVVDEAKSIPTDQMRKLLQDASDLVRPVEKVLRTVEQMLRKEFSSLEKVWNTPATFLMDDLPFTSRKIADFFAENLAMRMVPAPTDAAAGGFFPESEVDTLRHSISMQNMPDMDFPDQSVPNEQQSYNDEQAQPLSPRSRSKSTAKRPREPSEENQVPDQLPNDQNFDDSRADQSGVSEPQRKKRVPGDAEDNVGVEEHPEDHGRMSKKTQLVFDQFRNLMNRRHTARHSKSDGAQAVNFRELVRGHSSRKEVAQRFYSTLVLKKLQAVQVEQEEAYGDIWLSKGGRYEELTAPA